MKIGRGAVLAFLAAFHPAVSSLSAQTAQPISVQFSAIGSYPYAGGLEVVSFGFGWEVQGRWNPSNLSIGFGGERTSHEVIGAPGREVVVRGGFFEPRYVIYAGWEWAAPYLSGRAALSQTRVDFGSFEQIATGVTLNGGGGILVRISDRSNLDVGATIGFKDLGEVRFPIGLVSLGSGGNVVIRAGVALGIG